MSTLHNIIKIQYSNMGYLQSYPYHLTSDKEMFDAFLREDGFFNDYYPCPDESFREAYDNLVSYIRERIQEFLDTGTTIPNWVYSYMLMRPITYQSDEADIAYICELGNVDYDGALAEFNSDVAAMCLDVSKQWLRKLPSKYGNRPPTMFGETHVTKSLRLDEANILLDD